MAEYYEEPEYRGEGPLVWPWVLAAILAIILIGLIWWAAARPVTYAQPARPPATTPAPAQPGQPQRTRPGEAELWQPERQTQLLSSGWQVRGLLGTPGGGAR